jgi:hypothetical protein
MRAYNWVQAKWRKVNQRRRKQKEAARKPQNTEEGN